VVLARVENKMEEYPYIKTMIVHTMPKKNIYWHE